MGFQKGNRLGGRVKGTKNKSTAKVKETVIQIMDDNLEEFQRRLSALNDNDFVKAYLSLGKYVLPTLKSQEVKMEVQHPEAPEWLLELSEDDEDRITKSLE